MRKIKRKKKKRELKTKLKLTKFMWNLTKIQDYGRNIYYYQASNFIIKPHLIKAT